MQPWQIQLFGGHQIIIWWPPDKRIFVAQVPAYGPSASVWSTGGIVFRSESCERGDGQWFQERLRSQL